MSELLFASNEIKRYAFTISYNGKDFVGWQKQPNGISIQETIEKKLELILRSSNLEIVGCGRTDSGVHASDYVFHMDFTETINLSNLIFTLNKILPNSIAVHAIKEVDIDFHARFSAISRTYHYFLNTKKNSFNSDFSLYYPHELDFNLMNLACEQFLGTHDFSSFSKINTDNYTNNCTIFSAKWVQNDENSYYFEVKANRFLRNMVRAMVGTLLEIGQGKRQVSEMNSLIESKNRSNAGISVSGKGLFLAKIEY